MLEIRPLELGRKHAIPGAELLALGKGTRMQLLNGGRLDDWPAPPKLTDETLGVWANGAEFADLAKRVQALCDKDLTRPVTGSIHLVGVDEEVGHVDGTDRYRLLRAMMPGVQCAFEVKLPGKALVAATKGLKPTDGVRIYVGRYGGARIERTGETWRLREVEGQYPNVGALIPHPSDCEGKAWCDRVELIRLATNARTFAKKHPRDVKDGDAQVVQLTFGSDRLTAFTRGIDEADGMIDWEEWIEVEVEVEEPFQMYVNPEFLMGLAKSLRGDGVELQWTKQLKALQFVDVEDQALLMPIRPDKF